MENDKTDITIAAYDENAGHYAEKFTDYAPYKRKIVEFQNRYIPAGAHILDLGCGPGHNIKTLSELDGSCRFTGIDLSAGLIDIARRQCPQCEFLIEDLRDVQLAKTFDVVIASFCIVHLDDSETAALLGKIAGCLEPGGHLYLSFMEGHTSGFESTSFSKRPLFFNYYRLETIEALLGDCGFRTLEIGREDYPEPDGAITQDVFVYAQKKERDRR